MNDKILIDSHVLIWLLYESKKVGLPARQAIADASAVYISIVSLMELAVKYGAGKLAYSPAELERGAKLLNLEQLDLTGKHLIELPKIKLAHKDPFDALLLAQAQVENLTFLTADRHLLKSNYRTFAS